MTQASLAPLERRALERFVELLGGEYGGRLRSVWLYGLRARGELPHAESDIDVIVLIEEADWRDARRVLELSSWVEEAEGLQWGKLAPHAYDSGWPAERRRIDSFFIREVDRDEVVVFGGLFVATERVDRELASAARKTQELRERSDYEARRPGLEEASAVVDLAERFVDAVSTAIEP